jgi:hypothetical protein
VEVTEVVKNAVNIEHIFLLGVGLGHKERQQCSHIYTSRRSFHLLRFQAYRTTMYLFILHKQHSHTYRKVSRIFKNQTEIKI